MMDQKRFCIYATAAVGTIGGIIAAPMIGPLAIALPVLMGLFGRKMAEVEGLGKETAKQKHDKNYSLPYEAGKQDYSSLDFLRKQEKDFGLTGFKQIPTRGHREEISDFLPVFNIPAINQDFQGTEIRERKPRQSKAGRGFEGLKGARGSMRNEAYFRRHGR